MNTQPTQVFQCLLPMFTRSDMSLAPLSCTHLELQDFQNPSTTHLRTTSYTPPVIVCQSKSNRLLTTYQRLLCITLVATRHTFAIDSKPLTFARELGIWSPRPVFGAFNRYALRITTSIHNPYGTFNTLHAHFYQSAFHDDGSFNSGRYLNHEGVQCASRSANLKLRCYWWCTYEGTYRSRACGERREAAQ